MRELIDQAARTHTVMVIPAPVLAQVWRGGTRQALLSRFLKLPLVEIDLLTRAAWLAAGVLCGATGTHDVIDAAVVVCARERKARTVITSDPDDLRALDPHLGFWTP